MNDENTAGMCVDDDSDGETREQLDVSRPPPAYAHTDKTGTAFPTACYLPRRSHRGLQRRLWAQLHCSYQAVKIHLQEIRGQTPQLPSIRTAKRRACYKGEDIQAGVWTDMLAEGGQGGVGVFQFPNLPMPVAMKCINLSGSLPVVGLRGACGDGLWSLLCAALPESFFRQHTGGANVIHYTGLFLRNTTHTKDKQGNPLPGPRPGVDLNVTMPLMRHGDLYSAINRTHYKQDGASEHFRSRHTQPREQGGRVLDLHQATLLASDLVEGTVLIHYLGLIHSDLKPENVFITWANVNNRNRLVGKLMDFGSSGVMTPGAAPKGWTFTMAYCSPQRMSRISQAKLQLLSGELPSACMHLYSVTTLDDVYAIGLMLVEILFGREQLHLLLMYPERFWNLPAVREACENCDLEDLPYPLWKILLASDGSPQALHFLLPARLAYLESQGAAGQVAIMVLQLAAQCLVPEQNRLSTHQLQAKMRSLLAYIRTLNGADLALELSPMLFSKSSRYTFSNLLPQLAAAGGERRQQHWSINSRLGRCLGDGGESCGCELCLQRATVLRDGWWSLDPSEMWEPYYFWASTSPPDVCASSSRPDLATVSRCISTHSRSPSMASGRGSMSGIPIQHNGHSRNGSCSGYSVRAAHSRNPSCSGASRRQTQHRLATGSHDAPALLTKTSLTRPHSHLHPPPRRGYFTPELSDIESGGSTPTKLQLRTEGTDDGLKPMVSRCVQILPLEIPGHGAQSLAYHQGHCSQNGQSPTYHQARCSQTGQSPTGRCSQNGHSPRPPKPRAKAVHFGDAAGDTPMTAKLEAKAVPAPIQPPSNTASAAPGDLTLEVISPRNTLSGARQDIELHGGILAAWPRLGAQAAAVHTATLPLTTSSSDHASSISLVASLNNSGRINSSKADSTAAVMPPVGNTLPDYLAKKLQLLDPGSERSSPITSTDRSSQSWLSMTMDQAAGPRCCGRPTTSSRLGAVVKSAGRGVRRMLLGGCCLDRETALDGVRYDVCERSMARLQPVVVLNSTTTE